MTNFGTLKTKIIQKLTESYNNNDKPGMKKLLNTIRFNNEFKELYLFYEDIENKFIENKENAKLYVEEIGPLLESKIRNISTFMKTLDKQIGNIEIETNIIYENLDQLIQPNNLNNIDKKINAKRNLIEHLTTKKEIPETEEINLIENESLLYTVLASNFNVLYNNTLTENEKKELRDLLSISNEELSEKFSTLKEEVLDSMTSLITENSTDTEIKKRIDDSISEINKMIINKYNYYRLTNLKNGLI